MFDRKTYMKRYNQNHKEENREQKRLWYLDHKEESNARCKKWRLSNPEQVIRNNLKAVASTKLGVFTHYSTNPPKCARCRIDDIDVLCIDHINGGGSAQREQIRIEAGVHINFYNWLKKSNYPEGFQVLCFNCNMKKRIREKC